MPSLTNPEIEEIERALGHKLPGLYHRLLLELGPGPVGHAAEIYHPLAVRELYEPFFDDPSQLFNPYFPFGCQNTKQELWVIDASAENAASIWHETVPDDWPEEEWLPNETWIERHLEPEVRSVAPNEPSP
jgi:hypothetical protein